MNCEAILSKGLKMSCKIISCLVALTLCTSFIFQCFASEVIIRPPRNQDDLSKIAKGKFIKIEDYPYTVSLQEQWAHICGGSLVKPLWVLTAGHCISLTNSDTLMSASSLTVVAGLTTVTSTFSRPQDPDPGSPNRRKVIALRRHEEYQSKHYWNDIALVKLESSFGKDISVKLAPLASPDLDEPANCFAIGWGFQPTRPPNNQETSLQGADVHNVARTYCTGPPNNEKFYEDTQLCLDTSNTGNPCHGDSGGPLVCDGKQAGVTSYILQVANCQDNKMSVYTRVAKYRDWIGKNAAARTCQLDRAFIYFILITYVMLM